MEKITDERLREVLMLHSLYLQGDPAGRRADLTGADLRGADLWDADFTDAILVGADFTDAILVGADFTGAILVDADFTGAILVDADFTGAILTGAILAGANLAGANLAGATMPTNYSTFSQIGSEGRQTTYSFDEDKIWCGCFTGSLKEFEAACQNHESELHKNQYLIMIKAIKSLKKLYDNQ